LLKQSPDPTLRSYIIHRLSPLGAEPAAIVERLEAEPDVTAQRALILSLGDFTDKHFPSGGRDAMVAKTQELYRSADDPGLHGAAEWLLRHWKQDQWLKQVDKELASNRASKIKNQKSPGWFINSQLQTFTIVPGPVEFSMGSAQPESGKPNGEQSHLKRIGRTFAIATKPVTVGQFVCFRGDYAQVEVKGVTNKDHLPAQGITWHEAAAYCNWLSEQEGIPPEQWCYETNAQGLVVKLQPNYLHRTGYRLPTEAEWEYACRAGATTSRYFGGSVELLEKYGTYLLNSGEHAWPVGSRKPNDLGLFDMHGNVWCWCQEKYMEYPKTPGAIALDDVEDALRINNQENRVLRGGSFGTPATDVRSAKRSRLVPTLRNGYVGFRVARTISADSQNAK
jgi:formylglycine-generating enzyme required for sulfatase activity